MAAPSAAKNARAAAPASSWSCRLNETSGFVKNFTRHPPFMGGENRPSLLLLRQTLVADCEWGQMMITGIQNSSGRTPEQLAVVKHHKSFRGVTVDHNVLSQFTMYTVHLENLGIFISDSQLEAFNMAFDALFSAQPA
jgi:hypothetical protein